MSVEYSIVFKVPRAVSNSCRVVLKNCIFEYTKRSAEIRTTGKSTYTEVSIRYSDLANLDDLLAKIQRGFLATNPFTETDVQKHKWALRLVCETNLAGIQWQLNVQNVILYFKRKTNLFGIDAVIGENVKRLKLENVNKIESNILGLAALIKRGVNVSIHDRTAVAWAPLLVDFNENDLSIAAFQTALLKNGFKVMAKY